MKKRVLQFIGSFNQGGSERQAVALARLLKNEGTYDVFVATLNNEGVLRGDIEAIGLPAIPEFPLTSFFNTAFVRQIGACARYFRENDIDIVHTHDFYTNVFGVAAATLAGVKAKVASKRETGGMRSTAQNMIERLAFSLSDAIVVNSVSVREYLVGRGIAVLKTCLIYNGVDPGRFTETNPDQTEFIQRKKLPLDDDAKFVTLVANLRHDVKNVPMLLRAAKKLLGTNRNVHFVIAGEGELERELIDFACSLGIADNVHFIGRCTEVAKLLAVSDVCVLTSTAEGFSNSIIEYMAAKKPVVATNVGGAGEAVADGVSGYLVASDDDEALFLRLMELLGDSQMAADFGAEGQRIVAARFSEAAQLQSTLRLYNALLF